METAFAPLHPELRAFIAEMLGFKSEMSSFKSEMSSFKSEMLDFKSEMLEFCNETKINFKRLENMIRSQAAETSRLGLKFVHMEQAFYEFRSEIQADVANIYSKQEKADQNALVADHRLTTLERRVNLKAPQS